MRSYEVSYRDADTGEIDTVDVEVEDHEGENEAKEEARQELTASFPGTDTDEWLILDAAEKPALRAGR